MAFYPKALVRLTATVQKSRTHEDTEEVIFWATPRTVKVDRNEFSKADECALEFDSARFPVLPRSIREVLVQVYMGDRGSLTEELDPGFANRRFLQFIGYIDDPELSISETDGVIRFKARDFTGLLLDARRPSLLIIPKYTDDLRAALRRILDALPGGENLGLRLEMDGERSREWPSLVDVAPPTLSNEHIPYDPNDTLWRVVERSCDSFGLIPRIVLDELVVASSRGIERPARQPYFASGVNLSEYRERKLLLRVREGIALSGYDLSTGRYIIAQWPPSGDVTVAKKIKVATGKTGTKKKPLPVAGANGAPINPNEKRRGFPYGPVADEATLIEAAKATYEGRSRQEFEGSFTCTRLSVRDVTTGGVSDDETYDVLTITSGDRIVVDVLPQHRQLLAGITPDDRVEFLVSEGYQRKLAATLVRLFESGVEEGIEVFVRSSSVSIGEDGFRLEVNFAALLGPS